MTALVTFCTRKFDLKLSDPKSFKNNRHRARYVTYLGRACGVITKPSEYQQRSDYVDFNEWRVELWVQTEFNGPRAVQLFKQRFTTAEKAAMFLKENVMVITAVFDLWHPAENPWEKYNGVTQ